MALILVIDDSAYMRDKIRTIVQSDGHDALEAADGLSGLQTAYARTPDCIILDLIMPEMDGLRILKTLHDQGSRIPVIVVTADIQVSVQRQCLSLGAAAMINKPPQERELLNAVREVLSVHRKGAAVKQATDRQLDTLKEVINIGVGKAAAALNEMVKHRVRLEVPFVKVLSPLQFKTEMEDLGDRMLTAVKIGFQGPFSGTAALVISHENAAKLINVLSGAAAVGVGPTGAETLREVGNIVINGVMGSLGNILKQHLTYSLPLYAENTIKEIFFSEKIGNDTVFLLVRTRFKVETVEIEGNIILLFTVGAFDTLLAAIDDIK